MQPFLARSAAALVLLVMTASCSGADFSTPSGIQHHAPAPSQAVNEPLRAGEEFAQFHMAQPYTPVAPNGGNDEYRCAIVDPQVTQPIFLTGVQYQPQNEQMAHHTITFAIPPEDADEVRELDAQSEGEGWTCFGMDGGVSTSSWVDTWTPGGRETLFEGDMGYPLEPGSLLVLQIHYNLLGLGVEPTPSDQSSVRLRYTAGTDETVALDTLALSAPIELPCTREEYGPLCDRETAVADVGRRFGAAAGQRPDWLLSMCGYEAPSPGNTQTCDTTVQSPATVHATRGHMHLLGRAIRVELNPGTPRARVLLNVPQFDFDDQALHILPEPVSLKTGDILRTTCTYDAGLRAQLPQLQDLPPRYVVWGEGTADEMCAPLLTVSRDDQRVLP
jgi:hypothetical protein